MPYNNVGSCAFVSLIGVLSFYDTFFNDNIIPDFFENHFRGAESFTEDFPSPGVQSYRYTCQYPPSQKEAERAPYRAFVYSHQGDDLQCALTRIHNQTSSPSTDNDLNFRWSCGIDDYQTILNNFYSFPVAVNNHGNECSQTPQSAIPEQISSLVDQGLPVIVNVYKKVGDPKKHAVIAYAHHDGTIWANYGMRGSTHVPLLDPDSTYGLGYDCIEGNATISFPGLPHRHSNNYEINGVGYCGCNLSDKVVATEARENCPPTFSWMRDPADQAERFQITFGSADSDGPTPVESPVLTGNVWTPSESIWSSVINACGNQSYSGRFRRIKQNEIFEETTFSGLILQNFVFQKTFSPSEMNFQSQYFYDERTAVFNDGITRITTTRLRCGYIENQYIVLSPARENAGVAYLAYAFDSEIYKIEIGLGLWSNNEFLTSANGSAEIQTKDSSGNWVKYLDLLSDLSLSTDRSSLPTYHFSFKNSVREFRFFMTSTHLGDRNKGRLCIGNLKTFSHG